MTVKLGNTRLKVPILLLISLLLALCFGPTEDVAALSLGLTAHEGAHMIAARCLGIAITQLQLMPFGGAIQMGNPYGMSPVRLLAVAAAGPAGNLIGVFIAAALAHWQVLSPGFALALMRVNIALMLFNLLPALPLDGGRMLYALLCPHVGRSRAAKLGIGLGRGIAALLILSALYLFLRQGQLNLTPVLTAVFLLASASDERVALSSVQMETVMSQLQPIRSPRAARVYAVSEDCAVGRALRMARPDAVTLYAIYKNNRLSSFTDDRRLLETMLERGVASTVSEVGRIRLNP